MTLFTLRWMACGCAAVLCAVAVPGAFAQTYPVKPVRLISPFPPGGGTDAVARIMAQALSDQLGQQMIVDSRGGANGAIGSELAARAVPDGYTLVLGTSGPFSILPNLTKLPYDALKDFSPVSFNAVADYMMVVHPSLPVRDVRELLALAKARPGQLNYAAGGSGTPSHLAMELFNLLGKVNLVQVPYKGNGPAALALLTGECTVMIGSGPSVLPQVNAGKMRALATTGLKRSVPNLPAIAEVLPGYEMTQWYGILGPAEMPKDIVDRLQKEIVRAVANPKVTQVLMSTGLQPVTNTPDEFRAIMKAELEKWGRVAKAANIKAE
jgi:tripartite-type tricarboxylate transporter receptor subunit TctC